MPLNLCRAPSSARGLAVVGSAVLLVMMTPHASLKAQTSTQYEGPVCVAPPLLPEMERTNLTAVARDTTGHTATSATVVVNVANTVTTLTHNAAASPARRLDGID
jgi:hypothetical protein